MTAINTPPLAIPEVLIPDAAKRRRRGRGPLVRSRQRQGPQRPRRRPVRGSRPGWVVYGCLGVVLLGSIFPFYWSFLIGSGDAYTVRDPNMSWIPGGNFIDNALKVVNDPAVNFWRALWNSIYSSALIAASVVFFSTLAGWAFAKLRFRGATSCSSS